MGKRGPKGPSKYSKEYEKEVFKLCLLGATDAEVADFFEVTESTVNQWKIDHPKFSESLNDGKVRADAKVAKGLYGRAIGYDCPETKPQWVNDKKGGHWEYAEMIKHYPPEVKAAIHWLNNRRKQSWRERKETGMPGIVIKIEDKEVISIEQANNEAKSRLGLLN